MPTSDRYLRAAATRHSIHASSIASGGGTFGSGSAPRVLAGSGWAGSGNAPCEVSMVNTGYMGSGNEPAAGEDA